MTQQLSRANLTKKFIDKVELPTTKPQFIWDKETHGFGIKCNPSGIVYVVQGRVNGKTKRVTIGRHGPFTLKQARDKALELLRDMANGTDPIAESKCKKAASVTLAEVAEAYIADRELKPRTVSDIRKHLDGLFKDWKGQLIVEITRQKVLDRFRKKSAESKAQANQAFRILRALLNYARATYRPDDVPVLPENPCQILSDAKMWHSLQAKSRRIPTDQVGRAWNRIEGMRKDPAQTQSSRALADAIAFTLLTGARWGEVAGLSWDLVDLEAGTWHISDPKNKQPVTLPLSSQAKEILEERPKDNPFVFATNRSRSGHVEEPRYIVREIGKHCGVNVSVHDLRRTFRAIAAECGVELWRCKLLLNHKLNGDVTLASYTEKSDLRYLSGDAQRIGDWIERQAKIAANKKVVDLEVARKRKNSS